MAYPNPQALAPAAAARSGPGRAGAVAKTLANTLWMPLLFFFGFLLCYLLPFHAPAPHGVKVAVAGQVSAADISAGLAQQETTGAFEVIPVQNAEQAQQQVFDQAVQAAFVVNGPNATLYTTTANGTLLERSVLAAFTPIAGADHLKLSMVDLVPTVSGDPNGNSVFYLALAVGVAPYTLAIALIQAKTLSRRAVLAIIACVGAFASIVGFLVAYGLGAVPGQSLAMLYAFLAFEAIALTVLGLGPFVRKYIIGAGVILFVLLSVPSSGGAVPYQMVPTFFGWLHPIMPLGNLIDALRSIFYFDGTNMIRPTLVLCAWIAIGAALVTASALLQQARQRQAPPAIAHAGWASHELSGPAPSVMEPPAVQAAAGHAMPAGNGAGGFGLRPPPLLFGRITDTADRPIPGANITIIDSQGHQLLRTSTDRNGAYAADALPDDGITLLVSAPGRVPVATRVMLAGDLPVRRDVVIPDLVQSSVALA